MVTRRVVAVATAAMIAGTGLALHDAPAQQLPGVRRTDLQRHDLGVPGREVIQARVELAPGVTAPKHWHPGEEVGYIAAGTVEMRIKDRPTLTLHTGDPFLIPPRVPHNALDLGPDTGRMLSTYIVEIGQPLATFTE